MSKSPKVPEKLKPWIEARKQYRLSHVQIQMARELGMNPGKLGKLANHRQEPWKLPLPQFIEKCYLKRFGRLLETVVSIEDHVCRKAANKDAKRAAKALRAPRIPDKLQVPKDDLPF